MSEKSYGVLGAGSFGTALASLLAENQDVVLYARRAEVVEEVNASGTIGGRHMSSRITATLDLQEVAEKCRLIFPTIPSTDFRTLMKRAAPHLQPDHILIHTTKGLDISLPAEQTIKGLESISRDHIHTMSEVIRQETVVIRVGCLAGPNLATEILQGKPAATVIASKFDEVMKLGATALRGKRFRVYQNHDITGAELSGALKNTVAIASGILQGMELGENARALLVTMGLGDMIRLGRALGSELNAFLGLAGIGDLMATASSSTSRNFTVGYRLGKGEVLDDILASMTEVAEGVNTVRVAMALARHYKVRVPVISIVYRILFDGLSNEDGLSLLMDHPFDVDAEFL